MSPEPVRPISPSPSGQTSGLLREVRNILEARGIDLAAGHLLQNEGPSGDRVHALGWLGAHALESCNRPELAEKLHRAGLKLYPRHLNHLLGLAEALMAHGEYEQALEPLARAREVAEELRRDAFEVAAQEARCFIRLRRLGEARHAVDRAKPLARLGDHSVLGQLTGELSRAQREAVTAPVQTAAAAPPEPSLFQQQVLRGRWNAVAEQLDAWLKDRPDDAALKASRSHVTALLGDLGKARQELAILESQGGVSPELLGLIRCARSYIAVAESKSGQLKHSASRLKPDESTAARFVLAALHLQEGELRPAREVLWPESNQRAPHHESAERMLKIIDQGPPAWAKTAELIGRVVAVSLTSLLSPEWTG